MRSIMSGIKKALHPPVFILSCLGVSLACCLSDGHYASASGKTYTIMELMLFLPRDAMLSDISLNRYDIWRMGIGTWTRLLLPLLLGIGYLYSVSAERQSGFERMLLFREGGFRHSASRLAAAMISGGAVMLAGYLLFSMAVYASFPSIQEYPEKSIEAYMALHPGFSEGKSFLMRCLGAFLYGMCTNVFAYTVSLFFRDRYILACLPVMLKYIWGQAVNKAVLGAMDRGDEGMINICSIFEIENVLNLGQPVHCEATMLIICFIYLAGFGLMLRLLKKRGEVSGLE